MPRLAPGVHAGCALILFFVSGCEVPTTDLEFGACREDRDCPGRLTCLQRAPGELGECGCQSDVDCPSPLSCDLDAGRCTDGAGCRDGQCCLSTDGCAAGCHCLGGVCMRSEDGGASQSCHDPPLDAATDPDAAVTDAARILPRNACHGLSDLGPTTPGAPCECGGRWVCDGPNELRCEVRLEASRSTVVRLEESCDTCGRWDCVRGDVRCVGYDASGDRRAIGETWLVTSDDEWACHRLYCDPDEIGRATETILSGVACGGCVPPENPRGGSCGCESDAASGTWQCVEGPDGRPVLDEIGRPQMMCRGVANICGGCGMLSVERGDEGRGQPIPQDEEPGDELLGRSCGRCGRGRYECVDSETIACAGDRVPAPRDVCDGEDDDCDGSIDECECDVQCREILHRVCPLDGGCEPVCRPPFVDLDRRPHNGCECERREVECGDAIDDDCDGDADEDADEEGRCGEDD